MKKVLISPNKYLQGPAILKDLDQLLENFKNYIFTIIDPNIKHIVQKQLKIGK